MTRTARWLVPLVSVALLIGVTQGIRFWDPGLHASEQSRDVADLKDQLEKGLRARRPIEVQFVARVVQLVNQGRLSQELVQGTFDFTRKRYWNRKAMVPYFEQVLRYRAMKQGNTSLDNIPTTLPNFE